MVKNNNGGSPLQPPRIPAAIEELARKGTGRRRGETVLNFAAARRFIRTEARRTRPAWRVNNISDLPLIKLEEAVKNYLRRAVHQHRSNSSTFKDILL